MISSDSRQLAATEQSPDPKDGSKAESPKWVLLEKGLGLARQFRQDWRRLPPRAWKAWLWTIGVGWLITLFVTLLLIWLMRSLAAAGMLGNKAVWLRWVIEVTPFDTSKAIWLSSPGDITTMVMVVGLTTVMATHAGHPLRGSTIFLSYFLVSLIVLVGWQVWDRPRPELVLNGAVAPDFHSFPSGHMAQTTTVYGLFCYIWICRSRRRSEQVFAVLLLCLWLLVIGLSRLVLGTHWVSDVVGGVLIGLAWLAVLIVALRRAEAAAKDAPV